VDIIEHTFASGVVRLTLPLPLGPRHVHCYLLPGGVLVDTGLGLPGVEEAWRRLDGRIERVVVTHFHPDHVGAAALVGAPVAQGALDYEQCERVWGSDDWPERIRDWFVLHGVPPELADEALERDRAARRLIRFAPEPELLREGDEVEGWRVVDLPGHADGHIGLLREGVLVAGDHLLPTISPAVGLYPDSRPDPLGDYLASLERTIALAPRLALPGHGEPIENPAARAKDLVEHHLERLDATERLLGTTPRTAYELSLDLFGAALPRDQRRFAVAETLSHLQRLVHAGRAVRDEGEDRGVTYTQLALDDDLPPSPRAPESGA
jgi:glyoxylase-like metal-dependent hydrolase (beta-lactamase superfamily II)